MNVLWLESGIVIESPAGPVSPHAGVRYRALAASRAMVSLGHRMRIVQIRDVGAAQDLFAEPVDLVVCSRVVPPARDAFMQTALRYLECARHARSLGIAVVVDANDRHHESSATGGLLNQLMAEADIVVAGSTALAGFLAARTGAGIRVVGDPYELAQGTPAFDPPRSKRAGWLARLRASSASAAAAPRAVQLLWFGHPSNFGPIFALLSGLAGMLADWSMRIEIVSAPDCGAEQVCEEVNRNFGPLLAARFVPWSLEATQDALARCDLVVLPSEVDAAANIGKTANRLIESIRGGRFVVANPLPSYLEFSRYAWIGRSLPDGIAWALKNPRPVRRRIARGQEFLARHYSPEAIGRRWESAMLDANCIMRARRLSSG